MELYRTGVLYCDDSPLPLDAYGLSKLDAERGLQNIARGGHGIRNYTPPLVYGPGVKKF